MIPNDLAQDLQNKRAGPLAGRTRKLGVLYSEVFLAGLAIEAFAVILAHLGSVIGEEELTASPTALPNLVTEAQLITVTHYLADPILIFVAMYLIGRRINLARAYTGLSFALFAAGICGNYLGTDIGFLFYPIDINPVAHDLLFYLVVPLNEVLLTTGISVFLVGFSGLGFAYVSKSNGAKWSDKYSSKM